MKRSGDKSINGLIGDMFRRTRKCEILGSQRARKLGFAKESRRKMMGGLARKFLIRRKQSTLSMG